MSCQMTKIISLTKYWRKKKDPFRHMLDWKLFASSWKKGKQNGWKDDEKLWFWMKILQN